MGFPKGKHTKLLPGERRRVYAGGTLLGYDDEADEKVEISADTSGSATGRVRRLTPREDRENLGPSTLSPIELEEAHSSGLSPSVYAASLSPGPVAARTRDRTQTVDDIRGQLIKSTVAPPPIGRRKSARFAGCKPTLARARSQSRPQPRIRAEGDTARQLRGALRRYRQRNSTSSSSATTEDESLAHSVAATVVDDEHDEAEDSDRQQQRPINSARFSAVPSVIATASSIRDGDDLDSDSSSHGAPFPLKVNSASAEIAQAEVMAMPSQDDPPLFDCIVVQPRPQPIVHTGHLEKGTNSNSGHAANIQRGRGNVQATFRSDLNPEDVPLVLSSEEVWIMDLQDQLEAAKWEIRFQASRIRVLEGEQGSRAVRAATEAGPTERDREERGEKETGVKRMQGVNVEDQKLIKKLRRKLERSRRRERALRRARYRDGHEYLDGAGGEPSSGSQGAPFTFVRKDQRCHCSYPRIEDEEMEDMRDLEAAVGM